MTGPRIHVAGNDFLQQDAIRSAVQQTYAGKGRPSIDPVVFFKLQLVLFFEGIRSERQLMRHVDDTCNRTL